MKTRDISICANCANYFCGRCQNVHYEETFGACDNYENEDEYKTRLEYLIAAIRFILYGDPCHENGGIISPYWLYDNREKFKPDFSDIANCEKVLWDMVKYRITERQGGGFVI